MYIILTALLPKHLMGVTYYVIRARKISGNIIKTYIQTKFEISRQLPDTGVNVYNCPSVNVLDR